MIPQLFCIRIRHPITCVTLFARVSGDTFAVAGVSFGLKASLDKEYAVESNDPAMIRYADMVLGFLDSKPTDLSVIPLDIPRLSPFSRRVLKAARKIPFGKTVSYSKLAALAGNHAACRAAASVMRNNRFPLIIPCHRVIKSSGEIGGFMGAKTGKVVALKRRLLELEQVTR